MPLLCTLKHFTKNIFFFKRNICILLCFVCLFEKNICAQIPDTLYVNRVVCEQQLPIMWNGIYFNNDSVVILHTSPNTVNDTIKILNLSVSRNPITSVRFPETICAGDSVSISYGFSYDNNVQINNLQISQSFGDVIFLPDGMNCPPFGTSYISQSLFQNFPPQSTIQSADDILYLRLKMEHSAIEDLQISIVCPNGQSCLILPDYQTSNWNNVQHFFRTNFGLANRQQEILSCDSTLNPIGIPWNYVWSNNSDNGYNYAPSTNSFCFEPQNIHLRYNPYWDAGLYSYVVDSTDVAAKRNLYHPYQNFSNLIGCPLNGLWSIQIQDSWSNDNGYLVEWELVLSQNLQNGTSFPIQAYDLLGPWKQQLTDTLFAINPPSTLINDTSVSYLLYVEDSVGCVFDSLVSLTIYPLYRQELYDTICSNYLPFLWDNMLFREAGSQTRHLLSSQSCDSTIIYHLFVNQIYETNCDTIICNNDLPFRWHNITFSEAGTQTQNYTATNGCDSVVTYTLAVNSQITNTCDTTICENDLPLHWHGITFSEAGAQTQNYTASNGCDSVVTYTLAVNSPITNTCDTTICENDLPLQWHNITFSEAGAQIRNYTASNGCDSVVIYTLNLNYSIVNRYDTTICISEFPFFWHNFTFYEAGTQSQTFLAENGCDSIFLFQVDVIPCYQNIYFPNAITPNGDGLNDTFSLPENLLTNITDFSISIYNRWGSRIYFSQDPNFIWAGEIDNHTIHNQVVTYVISFSNLAGRKFIYKGSLTIL